MDPDLNSIFQGLLGAATAVGTDQPDFVYQAKQQILPPELIQQIGTGLAGKHAQDFSQWELAPQHIKEAATGRAVGAIGAEGMRNMDAIQRRGQRLGHEERSPQVEFARGEQDRATQAARAGVIADFDVADFQRADRNRVHSGDQLQALLAQSSTYTEAGQDPDWLNALLGFLGGSSVGDDALQQLLGGGGDPTVVPGTVPGDGEGGEGGTEPGADGGAGGGGGGILGALALAGGGLGILAGILLSRGKTDETMGIKGEEELPQIMEVLFPGYNIDPAAPYANVRWDLVPFNGMVDGVNLVGLTPDDVKQTIQAQLANDDAARQSFDAFMSAGTTQQTASPSPFGNTAQEGWYTQSGGLQGFRDWFMGSGLAGIFTPPDELSGGIPSQQFWELFFDDIGQGGGIYQPGGIDYGGFDYSVFSTDTLGGI